MNWLITVAKSKTLLFAFALAIFGVIELQIKLFATYMPPEVFGFFSITVGVVVAVLRVLTTIPLSEK
jgi:hypothetical protein